MANSNVDNTYLPAWRADLRNVNEVNFKRLGRNLPTYVESVEQRLVLSEKERADLDLAEKLTNEFIQQCYAKSPADVAVTLPGWAPALGAVPNLIDSLRDTPMKREPHL